MTDKQHAGFRSNWRRACIALVAALTALSAVYAAGSQENVRTFPGRPAAPAAWQPADWDVTVHSRDSGTWYTLEAMDAHHGSDCGAAPATHRIASYADAVFQCNDHIMTAINASGYGVIYLTPNQLLDFSTGEAVLRWDMSTIRGSGRDWIDLWISPYADHLQLPLESWLPDLNGRPRHALNIRMDSF